MARTSLRMSDQPRKYEIQNLWDKHHQVLRMVALGMKSKEIAETVGLSPTMVSIITNSSVAQDVLRVMRGTLDKVTVDVGKSLGELAPKAVEVLGNLLESDNERLQATVAMTVLDRTGHPAQRNITMSHTHKVTQEDIELIKQRALANGLMAIDAEYTDVSANVVRAVNGAAAAAVNGEVHAVEGNGVDAVTASEAREVDGNRQLPLSTSSNDAIVEEN